MSALRVLAIVLVALAVGVVALVFALTPPALAPPARQDVIISGVTLLNPGEPRAARQTIVVRAGRIAEIRETTPADPPPVCAGCYAMPGLIDAHVHTPPSIVLGNQQLFALLYLAHGVTSVRDVGQADDSVASWARSINAGEAIGPHVYRCGPVLDGKDPGWPSALQVLTPDEGKAAVGKLALDGVDCIKIYNHIDLATFRAISEEAARRRLFVVGHVPHLVGLRNVGRFDAQHLTGLPYLRKTPRWDTDIDPLDLVSMNESEIAEALEIVRAQDIALTPTITNFKMRLTASDPRRFPAPQAAESVPELWSAVWPVMVPHPQGPDDIAAQLAAVGKSREIVRAARARGIDVLAGTDVLMPYTIPGDALLREIEEFATAFGDNEAALESATRVNAGRLDPKNVGRLAVGMRADILILQDDPTADLTALRRWRTLIADGRRYERATIDAWLLQYREHFRSPLYTFVFGGLARALVGSFSANLTPEPGAAAVTPPHAPLQRRSASAVLTSRPTIAEPHHCLTAAARPCSSTSSHTR